MSGSSNEYEDEEQLWLTNLHEFLETIQPQVKEIEALSAIEDFLTNLESTDPHFHRHNFIYRIRDQLDYEVSPLIHNALNVTNTDKDVTMVSSFMGKIFKSSEFQQVSSSINSSIDQAAKKISKSLRSGNFDFISSVIQTHNKKGDQFTANGSMCSTMDGMDFMFMQPNKYDKLAKDLNQFDNQLRRIQSLTTLQHVPQTDLVASEAWSSTRQGILTALNDGNEEIYTMALKLISSLFISGSPHVVREYFLLLVENLISYFTDTTSHFVLLDSGLDFGDRRNILLLKKFRLLNDIQKELPSVWLRYSDKYVEEIIERTIYLLSISPTSSLSGEPIMNPLMFLSMVDPNAIWCSKWMYGFYSRSFLVSSISHYSSFLRKPLKSCVEMCKNIQDFVNQQPQPPLSEFSETEVEYIYSKFDLTYSYFLHSLQLLKSFMLFKDSRKRLHFDLSNGKEIDVDVLIAVLAEIVTMYPHISQSGPFKSTYHAGYIVVEIFHLFANSDVNTVKACLCFDKLYQSFIRCLYDVTLSKKSISDVSVSLVLNILSEIAISNDGCQEILRQRYYQGTRSKVSIIDVIDMVFFRLEPDALRNLSSSVLTNLFLLIQRTLKTFESLSILRKINFHTFLNQCHGIQKQKANVLLEKLIKPSDGIEFRPLSTESGSTSSRRGNEHLAYKKFVQMEKLVLDTLLHLALTPRGVPLFLKSELFDSCMAFIHKKCQSKEQIRTARNGYGFILQHVASTTLGIRALVKHGFVQDVLNEVWQHYEGHTNNYTLTSMEDSPQDLSERPIKKLYLRVVELLSSFQSVRELFQEHDSGCKQTSSAVTFDKNNENPLPARSNSRLDTFFDLMQNLILLDNRDKINALFHPEQTHLFSLHVLSFIVNCLDSMLYLQATFGFQEVFLKLQSGCLQHDSNFFIIDQCSLKRNQILVQSYLLGGPNERKMPMDTLEEDSISPYPWPLFCTYPVPGIYSIRGQSSAPTSNHQQLQQQQLQQQQQQQSFEDQLELVKKFLETKKHPTAYINEQQNKPIVDEEIKEPLTVNRDQDILQNIGEQKIEYSFSNLTYQNEGKEKNTLDISLLELQNLFHLEVKNKKLQAKDDLMQDLFLTLSRILCNEKPLTTPDNKELQLSEEEKIGVDIVVRYGLMLRQLRSQGKSAELLKKLLKSTHQFLNTEKNKSNLVTIYFGFDWFTAVVFLLFNGNFQKTELFLKEFSTTVESIYIWPSRFLSLDKQKNRRIKRILNTTTSDVHPIFVSTCHFVEFVLEKELPHVYSAFKLSGYPPSQICELWLRQCFLNYLDWNDIVLYIASCLLMGVDYQVYYCISILKHLERDILRCCQTTELVLFLRSSPIVGFCIENYLEFMKTLHQKYSSIILADLLEFKSAAWKQ